MKRLLAVLLCLGFVGCANSHIVGLKSDAMKGGPAFACDNRKLMYVTFANPTTSFWNFDINNSVIKHEKSGAVNLIWEQNQYQKEHDALGYVIHRADGKLFEPGHYTFKMLITKEGANHIFEGEFYLRYGRAIPIVIN